MARAYTHTRNNKWVEWTGILLSRYPSLRCGIESSLISGRLYCSYSLWVGIRVFNTRCSYGGLNVWSIWTMPAILRIFLYQTDASLSLCGSAGSYGQCATVARIGAVRPCNIISFERCSTCVVWGICFGCIVPLPIGWIWLTRIRNVWAYDRIYSGGGNDW